MMIIIGSRIRIYRFLSIVFSCIGFIFSYLFIISIALGHLKLTPIYERILVYSLIIWEYITGIYYIRKGKKWYNIE
mgnify:CR=1 FL=1